VDVEGLRSQMGCTVSVVASNKEMRSHNNILLIPALGVKLGLVRIKLGLSTTVTLLSPFKQDGKKK